MQLQLSPRRGFAWLPVPALLLVGVAVLYEGSALADDNPPPEPSPAAAEMLKSMREKGILSEEEYEAIYRKQAKYEADQKAANALPGWAKDWTFGGDLRLRYDRQDYGSTIGPGTVLTPGTNNVNVNVPPGGLGSGTGLRERFQIRLRVGAEKLLDEDFKVGFRIVTSEPISFGADTNINGTAPWSTTLASNPRTANVTLGNYFDPKPLYIDRAYLSWNPWFAKALTLTAGKFANPFSNPENPAERMVWDPDISPEGIAAKLHFEPVPETVSFDFTAGYFLINNVSTVSVDVPPLPIQTDAPNYDNRDPYMYGLQGSVTASPTEWFKTNLALSYYDLSDLNTAFVAYANTLGNGGDAISRNPLFVLLPPNDPNARDGASTGYLHEFTASGYLSFTPFGERFGVKPFFNYSQITNASFDKNGYSVGLDLGNAELLRLYVMYFNIGANGTVAEFIDDDITDGLTNVKGWYIFGERAITRFLRFRVGFTKMRQANFECTAARQGQPDFCSSRFAFSSSVLDQFNKTNRDRSRWEIDLLADF